MFVNAMGPLLLSTLLATAGASAAHSAPDVSASCAEFAQAREDAEAATERLAEWMDRHCPGSLEVTEPFCRLQSQALLEQLDRLGEVKATFAAKRCELHQVRDAGPQSRASLFHLASTPPRPVDPPRTIGSFDDNWPWPRRPTFQAGLAASAAFKIRRCRADPECEW